ncbi:hypothetical protein KRMM14A1259_57600 [Krasilnikovia sp. MM14-A1259]
MFDTVQPTSTAGAGNGVRDPGPLPGTGETLTGPDGDDADDPVSGGRPNSDHSTNPAPTATRKAKTSISATCRYSGKRGPPDRREEGVGFRPESPITTSEVQ